MFRLTIISPLRLALIVAAVVASTTQAKAQTSGTYTYGNCVYQAGSNAQLGCYFAMAGRTFYMNAADRAFRDEATGLWLTADAAGNFYIYTSQGWHLASVHPAGRWLLAQMGMANRPHVVQVGPNDRRPIVGASHLTEAATASNDRGVNRWLAPACTGSYNGC